MFSSVHPSVCAFLLCPFELDVKRKHYCEHHTFCKSASLIHTWKARFGCFRIYSALVGKKFLSATGTVNINH